MRFWFPTSDEHLQEFAYGRAGKESCPLVPGPSGTVFVHSGGALVSLASDLSSGSTVASMRQELWLTDLDEGTPEFPKSLNVIGVHNGKIYKSLHRTDYTEEVLIRRLQVSAELRQRRSQIRAQAPLLWPDLDENRYERGINPDSAVPPSFHHEEDMDKWDGDCRWLKDEWLWQGPAERGRQ